jgi:hypothetical protein
MGRPTNVSKGIPKGAGTKPRHGGGRHGVAGKHMPRLPGSRLGGTKPPSGKARVSK